MAEVDKDGGRTVEVTELRDWFISFDAGGGGMLGIALRNNMDKAVEVSSELTADVDDFLHTTTEEEEAEEEEDE